MGGGLTVIYLFCHLSIIVYQIMLEFEHFSKVDVDH